MVERRISRLPHERPIAENEQVAVALHPSTIGPLLEELFRSDPEIPEGQTAATGTYREPSQCHILDAKYEPGNYCRILYELGDDLVIGTYKWDSEESAIPETTKILTSLGMQVYRFPNDPALQTLIQVLDTQVLSSALAEVLPELQNGATRILRCEVKPLRFRPERRCTVRLDLWLREKESGAISKRVLYGKIYHDLEKARHVYQQMLSLSDSSSAKGAQVLYATATAFLPELAMVLQDPVRGAPLDSLLSCDTNACGPRGFEGILSAASALAAFHASGLVAGKPRSINSEVARFKKRAARIGQVNPDLGNEIIKLADALSTWLDSLDQWGASTCLVHGDCKPAQFLIQDRQIALLDFDHCGMADPAVDVGTFLATLQQMQVKQTVKNRGKPAPCTNWMPDVKRQFLETYCRASGDPAGFSERALWYEAVGLARKAIRGFERSPFSPLPAALVAEAWQVLKALPQPLPS